jgi:hypothetical protein
MSAQRRLDRVTSHIAPVRTSGPPPASTPTADLCDEYGAPVGQRSSKGLSVMSPALSLRCVGLLRRLPPAARCTPSGRDCEAFPIAECSSLLYRDFGGLRAFSGPAATVKCLENNPLVRDAVGEKGNGRVLVVDGGGAHLHYRWLVPLKCLCFCN